MDMPGEKLIIKMWETISDKGIGGLLKPWQIRREGRANIDVRCEEILALAQAERDVAAIRSDQKSLLNSPEIVSQPDLGAPMATNTSIEKFPLTLQLAIEIAEKNNKAETVRKEISIAKAVIYAEDELRDDSSEPPQTSPQDDWLLRWREYAAGVSSEEFQQIWGKVLAGEVKSPGNFSLRTLEFLRNLSKAEAQAIERIAPFVISGFLYRGDDTILETEGVSFSDLLELQELGVFTGVDGHGLEVIWKSEVSTSFRKVLTCRDELILATASDASKAIKLRGCKVTALGLQVLSLASSFVPNGKMINAVATAIKNLGFDVQIGSYVSVGQNEIKLSNPKQI